MDYKLVATVSRHWNVTVRKHYSAKLLRRVSTSGAYARWDATGAIRRWVRTRPYKSRFAIFLGRGKV